jgi:hypothetical protein
MQMETVFAIELLALAAGAGLLSRAGDPGIYARRLVKTVAWFICIAAIATMLSTAYFEIKFICGDYSESPLADAQSGSPGSR